MPQNHIRRDINALKHNTNRCRLSLPSFLLAAVYVLIEEREEKISSRFSSRDRTLGQNRKKMSKILNSLPVITECLRIPNPKEF